MQKKIVIFGAGFYGKLAFEQYDNNEIAFFIDNSKDKQGQLFCGKEIKSPDFLIGKENEYHVHVASLYHSSMIEQLEQMGISDYSLYLDDIHGFYESSEMVVNPYEVEKAVSSEDEWSESNKLKYAREEVNKAVERIYANPTLFNHIEIETINRCNGVCSFCPVNRNDDTREKAIMSEELFKNIVGQLEELKYSGRFTTFSNNEPLLDERIIEFNKYAREHLPHARMHLYTNGTLLTMDKFLDLIEVLDELIIDNYQQELKLIKPCQEIVKYSEDHPEIISKVTIVLRKPNEILTSRGGNAPNRKNILDYSDDRCILPFKQLIVRPTGKISLCCNDALGTYTLGDLNKEKIIDVWYGQRFKMVRQSLYEGRKNWGNCKLCDTFSMG